MSKNLYGSQRPENLKEFERIISKDSTLSIDQFPELIFKDMKTLRKAYEDNQIRITTNYNSSIQHIWNKR